MPIERLTVESLRQIIEGKVDRPATCIIKFYTNSCHLCHNLQEHYAELPAQYPDVEFFAFNVNDYPQIEKRLKFNGVPTLIEVRTGTHHSKIRVMEEPMNPHDDTWYRRIDMRKFIENKENQ